MISEKMKKATSKSSDIRAMFEEGKRLAEIYGSENIYDFSLGNPSVPPPDAVKKSLIELLESCPPNKLHGYTNNAGAEDVRRILSEYISDKTGLNYKPEGLVLTTGAAAALNIILKTLLNPGDEVIVFAPFFGEYRSYIENYDGVVMPVLPKDGFLPDVSELEATISPKTKAVIINTPNNPTGITYSERTLTEITSVILKKVKEFSSPIYLISDEPYRAIYYGEGSPANPAAFYKNTFTVYSYSKALSLPGERIGYVALNSDAEGFSEIMFALNVANRISGFVNAPSLFQMLLPKCMDITCDVSVYQKNRDYLYNMLKELGFDVTLPTGAFYLFPKTLIPDDREFCKTAKDFHILSSPGSAFGLPGYFRLAYCVPYETIVKSKTAFTALAEKYKTR